MTKYPRGSEWRKWDLHIHTPGTAKNDNFPKDEHWKEYLNVLERNVDIAVLGVTDYFSIDNYLKLKEFQTQGRLQGKYLIPNIELRILPVTTSEVPINLHVLFDPELDISCIRREFLKKLTFTYRGSTFTAETDDLVALGYLYSDMPKSDSNNPTAWRSGINQFNIPYSQISEALKSPCLAGHFIVGVSNKSTDGNSGIQDSALRANRQEIYRLAHIIFSSNPSDVNYFLGKGPDSSDKVIADYGSLKPCIIGSDAHNIANVNVFPGNRITWIKADPTFEGLKQIIYEPEERVRIQESQPETKSIYNLIDSITLAENDFWNQTIPINENLSVIIGGRSTGKSTLLASIAEKISPNSLKKIHNHESGRDAFICEHVNSVSVSWKDKTDNTERMVDYFPQSYMYEIAKDQRKVDDLVKNLIKEDSANAVFLANLENEIKTNKDAIKEKCGILASLYKDFMESCEEVKISGKISGIQQEIDQLQKNANELKIGSGMSDEEYAEFEKKQDDLSKKKAKNELLNVDKDVIKNLKNKSILNAAFCYEFNNLSEDRRTIFEQSYKAFVARVANDWNENIEQELTKLELEIASCSSAIQEIEDTPIYQRGIQYIAKNKQYSDYQEKINKEKEKLQYASSLIQKRDTLQKQIEEIKADIIKKHLGFREKTQAAIEKIKLNIGDLSITASSQLLSVDLRTFLEPKLRKKSEEEKKLIAGLSEDYEKDLDEKLLLFINGLLDGSVTCIAGNDAKDVLCDFLSKSWYSITYELIYQEDNFKSMSPGKQAFVILKLLLEFSKRKCPIFIDQPEDSLDNRAIYTELVTYLRNKKKERQIILVSHNPNVVVGADAEQVIVANQHGADSPNDNSVKFQYYSGALENSKNKDSASHSILASQGIREHVCDILEGGLEAFSRREKKYGIEKSK